MSTDLLGKPVRLTIEVEANVSYINSDGTLELSGAGIVGVDSAQVRLDYIPAGLATVIVPPLAVGDTIKGEEAYRNLPIGAVVGSLGGVSTIFFRTRDGFVDQRGLSWGEDSLCDPRPLAYLPEEN